MPKGIKGFQKGHKSFFMPYKGMHTEETKEKLRQINLGKIGYWSGKKRPKLSKEQKENLSKIAKEKGFGKWMIGKKLSEETKKKLSENNSRYWLGKPSEQQPGWKGGSRGYYHRWVEKHKGKAKNYTCEICRKKPAIEWSNLDHKYKKVLNDYRALCRSCHNKWDYQFNNRKKPYSESFGQY